MKYNARLWEEIYAARALETEQGVVGERADEWVEIEGDFWKHTDQGKLKGKSGKQKGCKSMTKRKEQKTKTGLYQDGDRNKQKKEQESQKLGKSTYRNTFEE